MAVVSLLILVMATAAAVVLLFLGSMLDYSIANSFGMFVCLFDLDVVVVAAS